MQLYSTPHCFQTLVITCSNIAGPILDLTARFTRLLPSETSSAPSLPPSSHICNYPPHTTTGSCVGSKGRPVVYSEYVVYSCPVVYSQLGPAVKPATSRGYKP